MDELKPCPFCGGEARIEIRGAGTKSEAIRVRCKDGVNCGGAQLWFDEESEAAAAWNRRAQPDNPMLTLEQLRQMKGNWAWIEADIQNSFHYSGWGKIIQTMPLSAKIIINNPGYITQYDIHRYSAKFYAHKPEEDAN